MYDKTLELCDLFNKYAESRDGAGVLFVCRDDNTALFLKRSQKYDEPGVWGLPGGGGEAGETPGETAKREVIEELGSFPVNFKTIDKIVNKKENNSYIIFVLSLPMSEKLRWKDTIQLNDEHDAFEWFKLGEFPKDLHSAISVLQP